MRTTSNRERPRRAARSDEYDDPLRTQTADPLRTQTADPLLTETPLTVQDDEEEVFDLGFIVEDRDDRRDSLLASWQRLDEMDTDEALETNRRGPLPEEVDRLEWEGVPASGFPTDARVGTVEAEEDEEDFAEDNALNGDPYESPQVDRYGLDEQSEEEDLDDNNRPEAISIRGRAAGVVRGLGTSLPQDIGAGGFSVEENPLAIAAIRAPEADEVEPDEINRMAGEGAPMAEEDPVEIRPVRPSDLRPVEETDLDGPPRPEVGSPPRHDLPKPEMGVPQPVRMPEPGETAPPPGEKKRASKPSRPKGPAGSR